MNTSYTEVDEGLKDYLGLVGNALAGVVSARHHGKAEVQKLLMGAKRNFMQVMGRSNQTWQNLTWKTLFSYMTMPRQLALTPDDIKNILADQDTKKKISGLITASKLQIPNGFYTTFWGKNTQPIGGEETDKNSAARAEIVVTYFLELGCIKKLERQEGSQEAGDDNRPTPAPTSAPSPTPTPTPTPTPASTQTSLGPGGTLPANVIVGIKQKLAAARGGTP